MVIVLRQVPVDMGLSSKNNIRKLRLHINSRTKRHRSQVLQEALSHRHTLARNHFHLATAFNKAFHLHLVSLELVRHPVPLMGTRVDQHQHLHPVGSPIVRRDYLHLLGYLNVLLSALL